jgi:hypothetical protein
MMNSQEDHERWLLKRRMKGKKWKDNVMMNSTGKQGRWFEETKLKKRRDGKIRTDELA